MKNKISLIIFYLLFSHCMFAQWTNQFSGTTNFLVTINFPTLDTGYVCDESYNVRRTTDGGLTWNAYSQIKAYGTYFITKNIGFAYGDSIWKTTNAGTSWIKVFNFPVPLSITTMDFANANIGYASGLSMVADTVYIFKTLDAGNTWSKVSVIPSPTSATIDFIDSNTGCLGIDTRILKTTNGGITWSMQHNDTTLYNIEIWDIHFPTADTGYAVGDIGTILKTIDKGTTWLPLVNTNTNPIYSVFFTDANHGWAVGGNGFFNSGTILYTADGGNSWSLISTNNASTCNSVFFPSANVGYACGLNGTIMKYEVLGAIFEENNYLTLSVYPNPSSGKFTITGEKLEMSKCTLDIYNAMGEKVYSTPGIGHQTSNNVDISSQAKGIYFIKAQSADKIYTEKVVVK